MAYEVVHNYDEEYKYMMKDIQRENERLRRKEVVYPDITQPRFSEKAETIRQGKAVVEADKAETAKTGSGYEIVDGPGKPSGGYEIVDPEPTVRDSQPSFRQGSVADVTPAPERPKYVDPRWGPNGPPSFDWQPLPEGTVRQPLKGALEGAGRIMERYEERVAKPFRERMFVKDPLDIMAERGMDKQGFDRLWHELGTMGVGILADPLTAFGMGGLGRARLRVPGKPVHPFESEAYDKPIGPSPFHGMEGIEVPRPAEHATGSYSGDIGARVAPATPEAIPYDAITPQVRRTGTGRYILPTGEAPLINDLARQHFETQQLPQASGFQSARPFVYPDETIPRHALGTEGIPVSQYGVEYPQVLKDPTHVFETPGFLRTAEEMVAGRQPIPESSPLHGTNQPSLRETRSIDRPRQTNESLQQQLDAAARSTQLELEQQQLRAQLKAEQEAVEFVQSYAESLAETASRDKVLPDELPPIDSLLHQATQAGPRSQALSVEAMGPQRQPRLWERVFRKAYDVLDHLGSQSRRLSDILRYTWDYSEQGTMQNYHDAVALVRKHYGERSLSKRLAGAKAAELGKTDLAGNKTQSRMGLALNSSMLDWGLTQKEVDALVELHEVGGDMSRLTPAARERLPVNDPKIQALFKDFWQIATGRVSSLPSVRDVLIWDPITNEKFPVGDVGPYWPHQVITESAREAISNSMLKDIYKRGYADKMPFAEFKEKFNTWWKSEDNTVRTRKYAGLEYKRMLDILEDAKAHNRTVAESLRKYGYETDPLRMLVRHNLYGLKRAATLEHDAEIKQLMERLALDYGEGSKAYKWIESVYNRSQGFTQREDFIQKAGNPLHIAQAIAYPAWLKGSWKQNLTLQPNYLVMQQGLQPVVTAVWKYFGSRLGWSEAKIMEYAQRSGATFPAHLAKYSMPEGLAEQYAKTAHTLNLFSPSDSLSRGVSGVTGSEITQIRAREFWKNPTGVNRKLIEELNINPDELYNDMLMQATPNPSIPDKYLMRGSQTIANDTMGRTGIRGLQNWASGDSEFAHVMLMLRRQILSNEGTLIRTIVDAPSAKIGLQRALRFMVGAEAAGLLYNGIANTLVGNDFFDVNKSLVKMFGSKEAAVIAKALLMGIGTFTSGIALTGLQAVSGNYAGALPYAVMSPALAATADELLNKAAKGDLKGVFSRVQPSEIVGTYMNYGEKERKERQRGGSGLSPMRMP